MALRVGAIGAMGDGHITKAALHVSLKMLIAVVAMIYRIVWPARGTKEQIAVLMVTCLAPWRVYACATIMTMMFVVAIGIGTLLTHTTGTAKAVFYPVMCFFPCLPPFKIIVGDFYLFLMTTVTFSLSNNTA